MNKKKDYQAVIVSISILTYNRCSLLRSLLLSLRALDYDPIELIVVDNHSQDETEGMICTDFPDVKYIRTEKNIGAAARNLGLRAAKGEIVVTLDDDIEWLDDSSIHHLVMMFNERKGLGAVNFRILDATTGKLSNWPHHCIAAEFENTEFHTYEITEGAVAFRKAAIEKTGYYPEDFFLSHEGPDLAFRLIDNGYEVIYSGLISVNHHHSSLGRKNWYNYYFDTRNQFWLAARNFPFGYSLMYLCRGLFGMLFLAIRDGYFPTYCRGIKDGLVGLKKALRNRKVLSAQTLALIKEIDSARPNLIALLKGGVLQKKVRL